MTRTERLFSILQMLREQRQPVTAATIGERFGISERTAYRDIATLTSRGATIVGEAGVGFVLRDDFFIPPLSFDADEAAALMLGLRFVLRRGDADLSNAATRARAKLAAVLPARFDDSAAARSPLVVAPPGWTVRDAGHGAGGARPQEEAADKLPGPGGQLPRPCCLAGHARLVRRGRDACGMVRAASGVPPFPHRPGNAGRGSRRQSRPAARRAACGISRAGTGRRSVGVSKRHPRPTLLTQLVRPGC